MSIEVAIIAAILILVTTLVALIALIASRRRVAREDEMRRAASSRGWQFSSTLERGNRVHRWTGSTDGVSWQAESMRLVPAQKGERHRYVGRWHAAWNPGVTKPIVFVGLPQGKETTMYSAAQGDSFFAKMAAKAAGFALDKAIDRYFGKPIGKEVDAGALHRVDNAKVPGFVVMAADTHEGSRVLAAGLEKSLTSVSGPVWSQKERPWILLRPAGISLARLERFRDVNELDAFVRAGVDLTRRS